MINDDEREAGRLAIEGVLKSCMLTFATSYEDAASMAIDKVIASGFGFRRSEVRTDDEREAEVKSYSGWDADEVARYPRVAADVIEQLRTRLLDEFRRSESSDALDLVVHAERVGTERDDPLILELAEALRAALRAAGGAR